MRNARQHVITRQRSFAEYWKHFVARLNGVHTFGYNYRRIFFGLVSNTQFHQLPVSQISRNLHTRRGSARRWILSENIVENLPIMGLFPKRSAFWEKCSMTSDFRPRYLRHDYKSQTVTTGWWTYGMLTFHLYHWNQLKVIPLACRARTRSVLSNARSRVIYIL